MSNKIALVSLDFAGTGSMCGGNKELAMIDAQLVETTIKVYLIWGSASSPRQAQASASRPQGGRQRRRQTAYILTISRRLGHGSPTITLSVYGHLFPQTDDRAALIMEAAFTAVVKEQDVLSAK